MTTDRQIEAVARAIAANSYHENGLETMNYASVDEFCSMEFECYIPEAKAAIDVMSKELSSVLHVGGVKHPQQLQWDAMMDELRNLQRQSDSTKYVPMLVEALKYYADEDTYWNVTDGGKYYEATNADQGEMARELLSKLPPELRGE